MVRTSRLLRHKRPTRTLMDSAVGLVWFFLEARIPLLQEQVTPAAAGEVPARRLAFGLCPHRLLSYDIV